MSTYIMRWNPAISSTKIKDFQSDLQHAERVIGHNVDFDIHIVGAELYRLDMDYQLLLRKPHICTMQSSVDYCQIGPIRYGHYKWPKLQELHAKLFGCNFEDAHNAMADITATKKCYFEMLRRGLL